MDRLKSLRDEGYEVMFLDGTWYDTHDFFDATLEVVEQRVARSQRILRGAACSAAVRAALPNCLYFPSKNIGDSKADGNDEINSDIS